MNASPSCPDSSILGQLARNALDERTRQRISNHVSTCEVCQRQLDRQRSDLADAADTDLTAAATLSDQMQQKLGEMSSASRPLYDFSQLKPSPNPSAVGRLGRYDVIGLLGAGGMGVVLKAHDSQLSRDVAIKVLSGDLAAVPAARERFLSEARAVAQLRHPNVVTIHSVDDHEGQPFLVMEMLCGGSLGDRIRHHKRLSIEDTIRYGKQIASALEAAHERGVIHRDVKPGNVMLEAETGRAKITDFGLAELEACSDSSGLKQDRAIGTPAYMSPEQADGAPTDQRSDLFSLGCVLYAMLSGKSPFSGNHNLHSAWLAAGGHPDAIIDLNPKCPCALSELIMRLIEKSPNERVQTAKEVVEVLERIDRGELQGADVSPSRTTKKRSTPRPASTTSSPSSATWPRWMGVGVLAACAIVVAGAFLLVGGAPEPDPRPLPQPAAADTRIKLVEVAKRGGGDVTTIGESLEMIAPGGTIRILDDAEYEETLSLGDRRSAGLTIESPQHATIVGRPDDTRSLLAISSVPRLTIRGLKFAPGQGQAGMTIRGVNPDLTVEDVEFAAHPESRRAVVVVHGSGQLTKPIRFRGVKVRAGDLGLFLGDEKEVVSSVRIEDCDFCGAVAGNGILLILESELSDVIVRRSVFHDGKRGVSLELGGKRASEFVVVGNAFERLQKWVAIYDQRTDAQFQFHDNLIANCPSAHARHDGHLQLVSHRFANNVWVQPPADQLDVAKLLAKLVDMISGDLLDPSDPRFLRRATTTDVD